MEAIAVAEALPQQQYIAAQRRRQRQQQQQRQQLWRFDIAGDIPPVLAETTLARGGRWLRFSFDDANKKTNQYYVKTVSKIRSHNNWSAFFTHIFLGPQINKNNRQK